MVMEAVEAAMKAKEEDGGQPESSTKDDKEK
jgi:hypothetical protein